MAEKSPGQLQRMTQSYMQIEIKLTISTEATGGFDPEEISDRICHVRDRSLTVFKNDNQLKDTLMYKYGLTDVSIVDILPLNEDSVILKYLFKIPNELEEFRKSRDETLTNVITIVLKKDIPLCTNCNICFHVETYESDCDEEEVVLRNTKTKRTESITAARQSMAQTHVEPLIIRLNLTYSLDSSEEKLQSIRLAILNTEEMSEYFRRKKGFQSLLISETFQETETCVLKLTVYNIDQLELLINLVKSGQLDKELEAYISTAVSGTMGIKVNTQIESSNVNEWKNFFSTRETRVKIPDSLTDTQKTFYIYIPPFLQSTLISVEIEVKPGDPAAKYFENKRFVQDELASNLWKLTVHVPSGINVNTKYKYVLQLNQVSYLDYDFVSDDDMVILHEEHFRNGTSFPIERNMFQHKDSKLKDGIETHCKHILHNVNDSDISDSIRQVTQLLAINTLSDSEKIPLAKEVFKAIRTKPSSLQRITFIVILSCLIIPQDLMQGFDSSICKVLLSSIKKNICSEIDRSVKSNLIKVIISLCKRVYQEDTCFIHIITYTYPFLDETQILEVLGSHDKYGILVHTDELWKQHKVYWETEILSCIGLICDRVIEGSVSCWLELILAIISSLPAEQTLKCIETVSEKLEIHKQFNDGVKALISNVQDSYESEISKLGKCGNIAALENMWKKINEHSRLNLHKMIEDALITCLDREFLKHTANEICNSVFRLCKYKILFRKENQQRRLLEKLNKSEFIECLDLFQKLFETEYFCTISPNNSKALVIGWWEEVVLHLKKCETIYRKIVDAYEKMGSLFEHCELLLSSDAKEAISDIVYEMLKDYNDITILTSLVHYEWKNEKAGELFFQQLGDLVRHQQVVGEQVAEVFFKKNGELEEINKRTHAQLIIVLMEVEKRNHRGLSCEKIVRKMVERRNFWVSVLTVQGKAKDVVQKSDIYQSAVYTLKLFVSNLNEQRFNKRTFDLLKDIEDELFEMFEKISNRAQTVRSLWERARVKMNGTLKLVEETISSVEKLVQFAEFIGDDYLATCHDVIECIKVIQKKFALDEINLEYVLKTEMFKSDDAMIFFETAKWLKRAVDSKVFININKDVKQLFTTVKTKHFIHYSRENFNMKLLKLFMYRLQKVGKERYISTWTPFIEGNDIEIAKLPNGFENADGIHEIELVNELLNKNVNKRMKNALLTYLKYISHICTIHEIKLGLDTIGIDQKHSSKFMQAYDKVADISKHKLLQLTPDLEELYEVAASVDEGTRGILRALEKTKKSSALIDFLRKVYDEDMSNLSSSMDEFSEYNVSFSTVSSLIDVKMLLKPLLQLAPESDVRMVLLKLKEGQKLTDMRKMQTESKIAECLDNIHIITDLYQSIANREERTKEIAESIIKHGVFQFSLKRGCLNFQVTFSASSGKICHSCSKLRDLKSRALLIMNSQKTDALMRMKTQSSLWDYNYFIDVMEQAFKIVDLCKDLQDSGHDQYQEFDAETSSQGLSDILKTLNQEFDEWNQMLQENRNKFPVMNYVYGNQITLLYQFFIRKDKDANILPILQYINRSVTSLDLKNFFFTIEDDKKKEFPTKGEALRVIAESLETVFCLAKPISSFPLGKTSSDIHHCVQRGRLYIARLEKDSDLATRAMLSLYLNTTSKMPTPDQVLLCDSGTCWDEIYLLLRRCEIQNYDESSKQLFCIAHVELLSSSLKCLLVEELQLLQNSPSIFLAIVLRCNVYDPFLTRFREYVMASEHLSLPQLRQCFQDVCRFVTVYSSDYPGLGKTEAIKEMALTENKSLVTVHISGPFDKSRLVRKLCELNGPNNILLHMDIGPTEDTFELDTFLFQLLFLRVVSAGTMIYSLQTDLVCLELATTPDKSLENNLLYIKLLRNCHLYWNGFLHYKISPEITSNDQVVCQYLKCAHENKLDLEDIYFTGPKAKTALSSKTCQRLLGHFCESFPYKTFPIINSFTSLLAVQFKRLSTSAFFRTKTLSSGMLKDITTNKVKSTLVQALIDISKTFSMKSVQSAKQSQIFAVQALDQIMSSDMANKMSTDENIPDNEQGIVRWDDSNHLIILFQNKDKQTVTALFKDLAAVPEHILQLFEIQGKPLKNIEEMNQRDRQQLIVDITRSSKEPINPTLLTDLLDSYVLTTDNILKMVLIWLRIQGKIPVILIGETGCGKTSLITYLAKVSGVEHLQIFNIHAGIEEENITNRVKEVNEFALKNINTPVWMFFDEINTTAYVGLLNDILCHRMLSGKGLAPNLVLLAACNPYKIRHLSARSTTGLQGKMKCDKLSHLVYRVYPLPEALFDYVWDFGSLSTDDERKYIKKIVQNKPNVFTNPREELFTALIFESQSFVRKELDCVYSVSLRDVSRCQRLSQWFASTFLQLKTDKNKFTVDTDVKAMILSLTHCYYCRFHSRELRHKYLGELSKVFNEKGMEFSIEIIENLIMEEQSYVLEKMELPVGTAKNDALRENVYMVLVSVLNRIPLFMIGKPGCSKSLSMQLIKNNLRGKDSNNDFFGRLPRIMSIVFQGSESCTSDGIIKVFEKAKSVPQDRNVLPLVILDEIGLAEISKFNPLKVLHSLLEPVDRDVPDVAVVGISNWALDAAKMNRAVHLCRPDMDYDDVLKTSISIVASFMNRNADNLVPKAIQNLLASIARAYIDYIKKQHYKNFHGLRDFYSLIKFFSKHWLSQSKVPKQDISDIVNQGISRNFGGRRSELELVKQIFKENLETQIKMENIKDISVFKMVRDNILDQNSRHLMLISNGDTVISLLGLILDDIGREYVTIIGSKFEDDQTDDYNYRNLSQIILCMEQGNILILKDLEGIYGSLYDMLNQNYTEFAQRKYCRVALGEYSNPMCYVANEFKCIVLLEENALRQADPPFISRFEKQQCFLDDLLPQVLCESERKLENVYHEMSTKCSSNSKKEISTTEISPISGKDVIITLILRQISETPEITTNELHQACLNKLLYISKPEAILQLERSLLAQKNPNEASRILDQYLKLPVHNGLFHFLQNYADYAEVSSKTELKTDKQQQHDANTVEVLYERSNKSHAPRLGCEQFESIYHNCKTHFSLKDLFSSTSQAVKQVLVFTHSNIHSDVSINSDSSEAIRIAHFKSKQSIEETILRFRSSEQKNLIIHFDVREDFEHLLLVKSVLTKSLRSLHLKDRDGLQKFVIIILHLTRNKKINIELGQQLNFLSEWDLVYLDSIEKRALPLPKIVEKTMSDVINGFTDALPMKIEKKLFWAFTRFKYSSSQIRKIGEIHDMVNVIKTNTEVLGLLANRITHVMCHEDNENDWVQLVASDSYALCMSSSLIDALEVKIDAQIENLLAKLIYVLEEIGALDCILEIEEKKWTLWKKLFQTGHICNIADVPNPAGPCSYLVRRTVSGFKTPFFIHFFHAVEAVKSDYVMKANSYMNENDIHSASSLTAIHEDSFLQFVKPSIVVKIANLVQMQYPSLTKDYQEDFFLYTSAKYCSRLCTESKLHVLRWIVLKLKKLPKDFCELVPNLHSTFWLYSTQIFSLLRLIDTAIFALSIDLSDLLSTKDTTQPSDETCSAFSELVKSIFRQIIPTKKVLETTGIPMWQRRVNGLFCLSDSAGVDVPIEQTLRFCHDLSVFLHLTYTVDRDSLQKLGDKLSEDGAKLESSETFNFVLNMLKEIQRKYQNICHRDLQRILCMYVDRCFNADHNEALRNTVCLMKNIFHTNFFDLTLTGLAPTLTTALKTIHVITDQPIFIELFSCQQDEYQEKLLSRYPLFSVIDECLKQEKDSTILPGMLVVILQQHIYNKLLSGTEGKHDSPYYIASDETIKCVLRAKDAIESYQSRTMREIAAVSFFRSFCSIFAHWSNNIKEHDETGLKKICDVLNSIFGEENAESDHSNVLLMYFLRCLEDGDGIRHFKQSCKTLATSVKTLNRYEKDDIKSLIDLHPLMPHVATEFQIFKRHLESGHSAFSCTSMLAQHTALKPNTICLCSLTILHCQFMYRSNERGDGYITKPLADKAYLMAEYNFKKEEHVMTFVKFLKGKYDLQISKMQLSSETSSEDFYITSVITQFICLIICQRSIQTIWKQILCFPDEYTRMPFKQCDSWQETGKQHYTCDCGNRVLLKENKCPICNADIQGKKIENEKQLIDHRDIALLLSHAVVEFLVHGCLLTSMGIGQTQGSLRRVLKHSGEESVEFFLTKVIDSRWQDLKALLGRGNAELAQFFQILFLKASGLFFDNPTMQSDIELNAWNDKLAREIKIIFSNELDDLQAMFRSLEKLNISECGIEQGIRLIQKEDGDMKMPNLYMRYTIPSSSNLHSMLSLKSKPGQFPFLDLTLTNIELLYVLRLLPTFIAWHTTFVNETRFLLNKNEVKSKMVSEFIQKCPEEKRVKLKNSFSSLKKSWADLSNYSQTKFKKLNLSLGNIGIIDSTSLLEECIILGSESTLFKIIHTLVMIQNQFLDNVLDISCTEYGNLDRCGCPAISFVNVTSTSAAIRTVDLLQVKQRDIIQFDFKEILIYSQCGLTPYDRSDVNYDFSRIEIEIALQLFGKSYITFPRMISQVEFADNLYQNSIQMFEDVKQYLSQKPLENNVADYLCTSIADDPSLSKKLLTSTEILLTLLRNIEAEKSVKLTDFVNEWKNIFPQCLLQERLVLPEYDICTCHIVSLYKSLEEIDGGFLIDSISQYYRDNLEDVNKQVLESNATKKINEMRHVIKALKITLHRSSFLKDGTNCNEQTRQKRVRDVLEDKSVWPEECLQGSDADGYIADCVRCIPRDLEMRHFYATIVLIQEKVKKFCEEDILISKVNRASKGHISSKALMKRVNNF